MSETGSMDEDGFRQWMDAYRRAYERRDPDAAASLFAEDATYQWGPFGDLLRGPAAIRARWAAAVGDSSETDYRFDYEVLAVTEDLGVARWMASAAVPARGVRLRYDGVFAVALGREGLCREFREWWNGIETPLTRAPARPRSDSA
jgi:ketosteroid isomerase-like protein